MKKVKLQNGKEITLSNSEHLLLKIKNELSTFADYRMTRDESKDWHDGRYETKEKFGNAPFSTGNIQDMNLQAFEDALKYYNRSNAFGNAVEGLVSRILNEIIMYDEELEYSQGEFNSLNPRDDDNNYDEMVIRQDEDEHKRN
jgi:hypothetical protein